MEKIRNAFIAVVSVVLVTAALIAIAAVAGAQTPVARRVAYAPVPAGTYQIDPAHSLIGFAVRHLEINWVEGRFNDFEGAINFDDKDVTKSSVEFTTKIASIDTEVEARDKHLRSADFFDAEKHPEMTFRSTRVERRGDGSHVLHGDLTIKGVTKAVAIPFALTGAVKDPWGGTRFGVDAKTKINRRDYGINYGNALAAGGLDVGNEVEISLRLEAVLPAQKPAGS
jgi:polyisoprenoid-binding protein YceI